MRRGGTDRRVDPQACKHKWELITEGKDMTLKIDHRSWMIGRGNDKTTSRI